MSDAAPHTFWVQVREPGNTPRVVTISTDTDVGRDSPEGLMLDDPTVSRRHLRLEPTSLGLVAVDLGSANGTKVDGERLVDPRLLKPGSRVHLGETELIVFEGRESGGDAGAGVEGEAALSERPSAGARRLLRTAARTPFKGTTRPETPKRR